jgi:hypothetical protein
VPLPPAPNLNPAVRPWRDRARVARLARALWIVWAFLLWNVVFDYVIVVAGRRYIAAAEAAGMPRANMDAYMRPAVTRALWIASAAAGGVLATGLAAIGAASRRRAEVTP